MHNSMPAASITQLLQTSRKFTKELHSIYRKLPEVTCKGLAHCCTLLPDMTFTEAVSALDSLSSMEPPRRMEILHRIALYFYLNPVKIMSCPFLEKGRCIIYKDRFLGCRTYGLWSANHYKTLASKNLEAKRQVQAAWQQAGINLPKEVIEFQVPYCKNLKIIKGKQPNDRALLKLGKKVAYLSQEHSAAMHSMFAEDFFMDLSFWLVSMVFGKQGAANSKFMAVKAVCSGNGHEYAEKNAQTAAQNLERLFNL